MTIIFVVQMHCIGKVELVSFAKMLIMKKIADLHIFVSLEIPMLM